MKIFIDSADIDEIKAAFSWGFIDGVTTNPSLIKKAAEKYGAKNLENYVSSVLAAVGHNHDVSLEVLGGSFQAMIQQGKVLYNKFSGVGAKVVVKIPVNPLLKPNDNADVEYDGIRAINVLAKEGIPVNTTLVMAPEQALLAAKAGAKYVSPFAGRIDDFVRDCCSCNYKKTDYFPQEGIKIRPDEILDDKGIVSGVDLVSKIVQIFRNYGLKAEVLAASVRNARQVRELALAGAHISTIPFDVLAQMVRHEKTYEGMQKFTADIVPEYRALFD